MNARTDYRNYINPGPKGSRFTANWQREFLPGGEMYVEDRSGTIVDALIRSVRKGTVVRVRRAFCLAPWNETPRKRRGLMAARIDAIEALGGCFMEAETGLRSCVRGERNRLLLGGYEDIATAGRAIAHGRTGRPPKYEFTATEWEIIAGIWTSRKYWNDKVRLAAIERRIGKVPGRTLLRNKLGSPHKAADE